MIPKVSYNYQNKYRQTPSFTANPFEIHKAAYKLYRNSALINAAWLGTSIGFQPPGAWIVPSAVFSYFSYAALRSGFKKLQNIAHLAPHIEFRPAKSFSEAENFAKKHLGIKNYDVDNILVANWVNEGLTNVSNYFKGKTYMFDDVAFIHNDRNNNALASFCYDKKSSLLIYKVDDLDKDIFQAIIFLKKCEGFSVHAFGDKQQVDKLYKLISKYMSCKGKISLIEKFNLIQSLNNHINLIYFDILEKPDKFLRNTKGQVSDELFETIEQSVNKVKNSGAPYLNYKVLLYGLNLLPGSKYLNFGHIYYDNFDIIYHEAGHLFHQCAACDIKKDMLMSKLRFYFFKSRYLLNGNASFGYKEFIAEIFAGKIRGEKYPPYIEKFFNSLSGLKKMMNE